jgi:hypothetical protein
MPDSDVRVLPDTGPQTLKQGRNTGLRQSPDWRSRMLFALVVIAGVLLLAMVVNRSRRPRWSQDGVGGDGGTYVYGGDSGADCSGDGGGGGCDGGGGGGGGD